MIEITIGGVGELERPEADIVQGLVINAEGGIRVLDQLMDRQGGIVWLNNSVGDLFN